MTHSPRHLFRAGLACFFAVILGVIFLPSVLLNTSLRDWVLGTALTREGIELEIGKIRAGWFTPVQITNLSVGPVKKPRLINIDAVRSDRTFWSAIWEGVEVGALTLDRPVIHIWIDEHGSNLEFPRRDRPEKPQLVESPAASESRRKELQIDIRGAELWLKSRPMSAETSVIQQLDLRGAVEEVAGKRTLSMSPGRVLDHAPVTAELCHGLLKYFVPVLAEATWTEGELSLELDACTIDLDQPDDSVLSGVLTIHDVRAGVKNELIAAAGKRVAKWLGGDGFDMVQLADEADVHFEVRDGAVWHEGLEFGLPRVSPDLVVRTSGSVSFSDQLNLLIEIPLPLHLLSDGPVADAIREKSISLAATGTFQEPLVELADETFLGDLLSAIGGRLAEEDRPLQSMWEGIRGTLGRRRSAAGRRNAPNNASSDDSTDPDRNGIENPPMSLDDAQGGDPQAADQATDRLESDVATSADPQLGTPAELAPDSAPGTPILDRLRQLRDDPSEPIRPLRRLFNGPRRR